MALALELSRREQQPHQKPRLQHARPPAESDRPRPGPYSAATHRSFSSAPFFHYGGRAGGCEGDEEDEELQMALACSLSEMEAQQRAAATDLISGAGGGIKVGDHRGGGVLKTEILNAAVSEEEERGEEGQCVKGQGKIDSGPGGKVAGGQHRERGPSPGSLATANTEPLHQCNEEEVELTVKNTDSSVRRKKKCGCVAC